jgi:opacity protein-like surface antigen
MKHKKVKWRFLLALFCFMFVGGTAAGSNFFIGVQGGWSSQKPKIADMKFDSDTSFLYGARAGVKFMMLALEANYFQAAHNLLAKDGMAFDWNGREIDYSYLGLNLRVYFPLVIIHPFLTAGYGYYRAHIKDVGKDREKGFNFGAGAELRLGDKFSLLAEGKYHRVTLNIDESELKLGDFTLSGGFNIYF